MTPVVIRPEWIYEAAEWQRKIEAVWMEPDGSERANHTNCIEPDRWMKGRIGESAFNWLLSSFSIRYQWSDREVKTRAQMYADPGRPDFTVFVNGQAYGLDVKAPAGSHHWGLGINEQQLTHCLKVGKVNVYVGGRWLRDRGLIEFYGYARPQEVKAWPLHGRTGSRYHLKQWSDLKPIESLMKMLDKVSKCDVMVESLKSPSLN